MTIDLLLPVFLPLLYPTLLLIRTIPYFILSTGTYSHQPLPCLTLSFHHILLLPNLIWPYLTFACLTYPYITYPKLSSLHQNTTAPHYDYTTTTLHYTTTILWLYYTTLHLRLYCDYTTLRCTALQTALHFTLWDFTTLRYATLRYDTIQYDTIRYNTIQYTTLQERRDKRTDGGTGKTIYKTPTKLSLFVLNSLPVPGIRYRVLFNTSIVGNSSTEIPEFLRL